LTQEVVTLPSVTLPFKKLGNVIINSRPIGEGFFGKTFLIDAKVGFRKESVVVKIPKFAPSLETELKKKNGIKLTQPRHEINVLKKMGLHVDDMVIDDGRIIIAMKLAKGTNLQSFLTEIKTKEDLHQLKMAANKAMEDMHSRGVIHNDLHSGNIMVERNTGKGNPFTVRIIDFGMADVVPWFERSNWMGLIDSINLELIFEGIARELQIELT
jgi:serine/threonine protein kinase